MNTIQKYDEIERYVSKLIYLYFLIIYIPFIYYMHALLHIH